MPLFNKLKRYIRICLLEHEVKFIVLSLLHLDSGKMLGCINFQILQIQISLILEIVIT